MLEAAGSRPAGQQAVAGALHSSHARRVLMREAAAAGHHCSAALLAQVAHIARVAPCLEV